MAAHGHTEHGHAIGQDSFLDVVTNLVGILIILVMVVGLRLKKTASEPPPDAVLQAAAAALERDRGQQQTVVADVRRTAEQFQGVQREIALRRRERDNLALVVAAAEQAIGKRTAELDAPTREDFDLQRSITAARTKLDELQRERIAVETARGPTEILENHPTPISQAINGREVHFQLKGGRLAYVPLDHFIETIRTRLRAKADALRDRDAPRQYTDTIGPEGGFRLRYTVSRRELTERRPEGLVRMVALDVGRWTILPVESELGVPVAEALAEGSELHRVLASEPRPSGVSIWVYGDSFQEFRKVRDDLHRRGVPVAAWPLPEGHFISGSPDGYKSSAE